MLYRALADTLVVLHLGFVLFVVAGGLLVLKWRRAMWIHLPAAAWGVLIELVGWICPLTPLENWLRAESGDAGYAGAFVEHYLLPVLYPAGLTRNVQIALGLLALAVNVSIYSYVFWCARERR